MNADLILRKRADLTPDREALVETATGRRFSFGELERRASQTARCLAELGIEAGDRVAVLAGNSVLFVDLLFGCLKLGAILNPLNWRLAAPELVFILNNSQPKMLVAGPEYVELMAEIRPQIELAVCAACEGAKIPGAIDFEKAVAREPADSLVGAAVEPDATACLMYTSGTTGRPKGAMIPHRQILWNAINTVISWDLSASDVSPIFTPMFHAGGLFVFLTPLFYCGGRLVVEREFDPAGSLRTIENEGCTVILGVPTLFQMWLDDQAIERARLDRVRWFISGGAPCPPSLIVAWREQTGTTLKQGYGLTEAGTNCFSMTEAEANSKVGSVGKPIFHSRMRLVDSASRDVHQGEAGQLLIAGPHVMSGYWKNSEGTDRTLRNGWLYTGDMARQDEDGYFYIVGRFKDMIISGGENVYAAEVEAVLQAHPAVQECALIGKPDEKWGEIGLMIVVPADLQRPPTVSDLFAHCSQALARYKIPKEFVFTNHLPYSPYGKVEKIKLKEKYLK